MAAGLDESAFARASPGHRPLNLGLGSSSPVEHYLIYLRQDRHRAAAVYYGFLDTQLTDTVEGGWSTLIGNRAMAYYLDLDAALGFYAANDVRKALELRAVSHVPMLVERYTIWARIERIRRTLGGLGLAEQAENRFGRTEDFLLLEPDQAEFSRRCGIAASECTPLTPAVEGILMRAKGLGVPAYVVEMPMTEAHRQRFYSGPEWTSYRAHLVNLVSAAGGHYVPAADWASEDGFADNLHLNSSGAKVFSSKLSQLTGKRE